MKKILSILAITAISFSVTAQEKRETPKQNNPSHQKQMHHGGKHHGQMMKNLDLTDAQKVQMKANREEYKNKMQLLKQDQNMTMKVFNEKKEALHKEQKAKMLAVLTPEQKNKMAGMKATREKQKEESYNKHFEEMKKSLALSDDQAAKLKAQHESTVSNMKAIRENEKLSIEERKQQMKAIKESSKEQRKNILTADQFKKLEEMRKNKMEKGKQDSKKAI